MLNQLKVIWQYCLPQHLLSRLVGRVAEIRVKRIKNALIRCAISRYKINLDEAISNDINDYPTFNAFFTRELKPGVRPISDDDNEVCSPVDGTISQLGTIDHNQIFQAKGHHYSIDDLLGGKDHQPASFDEGSFATIYLAPKDYHRIHMPVSGELTRMVYVPGRLFSVNPLTTSNIPNLFARNERVICYFKTTFGTIAVIMVGAMLVASIKTPWAGIIAPHRGNDIKIWDYADNTLNLSYKCGDEIGQFCFGSTVIVLFPKQGVEFAQQLKANSSLQLGQTMGHVKQHERHQAA